MQDPTRGPERRSLDPTRTGDTQPPEAAGEAVRDVTAGRAAGTAWNAAMDPTRPATPADPRR
jgi:hypothetical protein